MCLSLQFVYYFLLSYDGQREKKKIKTLKQRNSLKSRNFGKKWNSLHFCKKPISYVTLLKRERFRNSTKFHWILEFAETRSPTNHSTSVSDETWFSVSFSLSFVLLFLFYLKRFAENR